MSDVIVGLDLGTSTIRVVIGEFTEDNKLQIIGLGSCPSQGLRNGVIVNIEAAMQDLKKAILEAELSSGEEVSSCITAIGGAQIDSLDSRGSVAVATHGNGTREITRNDVERVHEAATAVVIPMDRKILHVVPQYYTIDGQPGIKDPINNIGVRLEVAVHIITCSVTSMQNIQRCVTRAGYGVDGIMLKTLAAAHAVMTEEELELGSILIDLGGGTTDVLVVDKGAPICTASIPVGGILVTNDIAIGKGVSFETAEHIKTKSGCCWEPVLADVNESIIIPGVGGRAPASVPKTDICHILQPRMRELFMLVREQIVQRTTIRQLSGNIVLVGGGAQMMGIVELAQEVFNTEAVRIGIPSTLGSAVPEYRTPEYATAAGLLVSNVDKHKAKDYNVQSEKSFGILSGLAKFFKDFF